MGDCEPMDVDSEFDDKENVLTCRQKLQSIENVIDDLDASEINMKLRMSCTPMSSPLTSSTTCNSKKYALEAGDNSLNKGINLTNNQLRSSGDFSDSNLTNSQSTILDNFGNTTAVQDITFNLNTANNNVTITLDQAGTLEKENSTRTSTSAIPTVHKPDEKPTSPILRGLKSVLNMFRPSQSPISSEACNEISDLDRTLSASPHISDKVVLSSTPVSDHKARDFHSSCSPQKQAVSFNDDLVGELQWNDETIIFGNDKVPIKKLFPATVSSQGKIEDECEAMDISMSNTFDLSHCAEKHNSEAQVEFHDCTNICVIKESAMANEHNVDIEKGNEKIYKVSSSWDSKKYEETLPDDCADDQFQSLDNSLSIVDLQTHNIANDLTFNTIQTNKSDGPCKPSVDSTTNLNKINDKQEISRTCLNAASLDTTLCENIHCQTFNAYDKSELTDDTDSRNSEIVETNNRDKYHTNENLRHVANNEFDITNIKTESLENKNIIQDDTLDLKTSDCKLSVNMLNKELVGTLTELESAKELIDTVTKNDENSNKQPENKTDKIIEETTSKHLILDPIIDSTCSKSTISESVHAEKNKSETLTTGLHIVQSLLEKTDLTNEKKFSTTNELLLKCDDHKNEDKTLINTVVNNKDSPSHLIEPSSLDQLSLTILDQSKPENDLQNINMVVDELIERLDRDLFTSNNKKSDPISNVTLLSDSNVADPSNDCNFEMENKAFGSNNDISISSGLPEREISDVPSHRRIEEFKAVSELASPIKFIPEPSIAEEFLPLNKSSGLISSSQSTIPNSVRPNGHNNKTNLITVPEHLFQSDCQETIEHNVEQSTISEDQLQNKNLPESEILPCAQSVYISADDVFDSQRKLNQEFKTTVASHDNNLFQTVKLSHSSGHLNAPEIITMDLNTQNMQLPQRASQKMEETQNDFFMDEKEHKTIESDEHFQNSSTNTEIKIDNDSELDSEQYIVKNDSTDSTQFDDTSDLKTSPDETVIEVNTEDEDTAEGPFVENEDLLPNDEVKVKDLENTLLEDNFLSLCKEKTSEWTSDLHSDQRYIEGGDTNKTDTLQDICEFKSGELFINAEDFDFFMNKTTNNEINDCGKESLFLKFDPLCAQPVPTDVVVTTDQYENKPEDTESDNTLIEQSVQPHQIEHTAHLDSTFNLDEALTFTKTYVDKPVMAVTPALSYSYASTSRNTAQNSFCTTPKISSSNQNSLETPRNMQHLRNTTLNAGTPILPTRNSHTLSHIPHTPRTSRKSTIYTSPAIAAIDQLISLSGNNTPVNSRTNNQDGIETLNQLKNLLVEREQQIISLKEESQTLYSRLSDLEGSMKTIEKDNLERIKNIEDLTLKLNQKTKENQEMAVVVEEYERTIATLIREKDENRISNERAKAQLIQERDEQTAHLASMEVSFNDLHSKYEKSKQIILGYKANENVLRSNLTKHEQTINKILENYEALKEHATSKLNESNTEWEKFKKTHEAEVLKLSALIKRKDLHISSLEETLSQKTKANEELTAICDELLSKVA